MNQSIAVLIIILLPVLTSCITTSENQPRKWDPEERAEAHVNLGMTYLRRNKFDTANSEFDTAISINPKSDTAHHAKALLLAQMGNHSEAITFFEKSVSLNAKNYQAINDYGIHLCQQRQVRNGISRLAPIDGLASNNQSMGTRLGLGVCYFMGKRYTLAEKYLRLVLYQSSRLPQALLPMAEINFNQKKNLQARGFLERYFGAGFLSERALFLAANVEFKLGDKIKANQYRRELRRRYPLSAMNNKLDTILN